jgi:hypothetical protein
MTKFYTIGEIFRLELLKNHEGQPYKDKATISRIVNLMHYKLKKTPFGPAKVVSEKEIKKHNSKWK